MNHFNSFTQNAKGRVLNAELVHSDRNQLSITTPEDVANAVEYLAGDLSAYVSGQHLMLNGGAPA